MPCGLQVVSGAAAPRLGACGTVLGPWSLVELGWCGALSKRVALAGLQRFHFRDVGKLPTLLDAAARFCGEVAVEADDVPDSEGFHF